MLDKKNILIGVTGGIAAYKVVEVASRLKKAGANVRVMMTRAATEFVSPRTFQEITGNAVFVEMFGDAAHFHVAHVALADFADLVLIAPATANFLAKAAHGIADDLLTTTILAFDKEILIAPSMNTKMYENPATQANLAILKARGVKILEPASGNLACGVVGKGRLPEPEEIFATIEKIFAPSTKALSGKKILVTAGGTVEAIDPVRYIGNRSSGRMGYEIAKSAVNAGAEVILISGKSELEPPNDLKFIKIESALQMREAVLKDFDSVDAVIMSAAVADYRVKNPAAQKIKKSADTLTLELVKNPDILKELGGLKNSQVLVGFAAETQNILEYANKKLVEKNLDFIVANDVTAEGAGFGVSTNIASIIWRGGNVENFPKMSKADLAEKIIERVASLLNNDKKFPAANVNQ
ncbi:MAG: bifunctional phosphopantothenoylcysteine decarboxylase/phosphopantothenate--cysteine ligase CoaBC [Selenomonadaceae bacterium]|nr:bifunctional phosphopantothenoylcysteine decarboxylase/phosphopantothenate--cysteine ligase CoaBC [Selenomonadaceae bacterium]